jgi:hypothetical protein
MLNALCLDNCVKYVTHGFLWKPVDGLDNLTWWLFEKTGA